MSLRVSWKAEMYEQKNTWVGIRHRSGAICKPNIMQADTVSEPSKISADREGESVAHLQ